jgi:hypothetical protein
VKPTAAGIQTKVTNEMASDPETVFLLRRAQEEAIRAIQTDRTPAAAAHLELSLRYSARARALLDLDQPASAARPHLTMA